ncbi:hypothetical protein WA538_003501, partial [Blastocystis sp. DL]
MSTESEFETVVPDTDIESGAVSSSGLIAPQSSAPKEAQAPASSGFRFLNFSGLQQFFDVDTSDITKRLRTSLFLWEKGNTLSVIEKKPDLYVAVWGGILISLVFCMLHLGEYRGYDAVFPCCLTYIISLVLLAAGFWVTSVYMGASLGVFNCISFSSYLLFDSNVVLSLQMFSHEYCFNLLYYLGFVIQLLLCGGMCYFSLYSRFIEANAGKGKFCFVAAALWSFLVLTVP